VQSISILTFIANVPKPAAQGRSIAMKATPGQPFRCREASPATPYGH
jgi:hypothetical protein